MQHSSASSDVEGAIALDLGGTKLASGLFVGGAHVQAKRHVPLEGLAGKAVGELVAVEVSRLMSASARRGVQVRAVGVSVPGIAEPRTGHVWAPNIAGWEDFPLRAEVEAAVNNSAIRVVVESDRSASILGEAWQGAARGCRDAVFVAVGTGIGAGIIADGRVLQGAHGIAGAIGWLALDRPFRAEYISCGCLESHASGEGIVKVAREVLAVRKSYGGALRRIKNLTAPEIFSAYESGDEAAEEVLRHAIEFWGMASANLVSLLNPEKIIFGGGVFGPAARFLSAIAAEARHWAQPVAIQRVEFEAAMLGSDAALYGAAYLALHGAEVPRPAPRSSEPRPPRARTQ